mmetsp:Transcript_64862/g.154873  ORF Transcript_64862/g.154873 Transcript_64862/m.154873 type:complete len:315 (+) Transcript_64862:39-983(+)
MNEPPSANALELVLERFVAFLDVVTLVEFHTTCKEPIHASFTENLTWGRTLTSRMSMYDFPDELIDDPAAVSHFGRLHLASRRIHLLRSLETPVYMEDMSQLKKTTLQVQRLYKKGLKHLEAGGEFAVLLLGSLAFDHRRVGYAICERDDGQCSSEPLGIPQLILQRPNGEPELHFLIAMLSRGALYLTLAAAKNVYSSGAAFFECTEQPTPDMKAFSSFVMDLQSLDPVVPMRATDVWLKGPGHPGYPGKNSLLVPDHEKAVEALSDGLPTLFLLREWHSNVFADRESTRQLDSLSLDTVRWHRDPRNLRAGW